MYTKGVLPGTLLLLSTDYSPHSYRKMLDRPFLLALICMTVGVISILMRRQKNVLPPGPPSLPLLGNGWRVPTETSWVYFHSLCQRYGT